MIWRAFRKNATRSSSSAVITRSRKSQKVRNGSGRGIVQRGAEDFKIFLNDVGRLAPIVRAQIIRKDRQVVFRVGGSKAECNTLEELDRLIRFNLFLVGLRLLHVLLLHFL